jgi:hypothetical protein
MSARETPAPPRPAPDGAPEGAVEGTAERRGAERISLDRTVAVHVDGMTALVGRVGNLSVHGVLVALDEGVPLGAEARLEFALEDEPAPLQVRGLVLRSYREPADERPFRVAFCFINPPASVLRRLSRLVFG